MHEALALTCVLLSLAAGSAAQERKTDELARAFSARLDEIASKVDGSVAYLVVDVTSGQRFARRADEPFPTASAIKIGILYELFVQVDAGREVLDDPRAPAGGEPCRRLGDPQSSPFARALAPRPRAVDDPPERQHVDQCPHRQARGRGHHREDAGTWRQRLQAATTDARHRGRGSWRRERREPVGPGGGDGRDSYGPRTCSRPARPRPSGSCGSTARRRCGPACRPACPWRPSPAAWRACRARCPGST